MPNEFFQGAAKRLDGWDAGVLGRAIGLTEDHVRAIMAVEAAGRGFDKEGRVKMLFEPHVFWRRLSRRANENGKVRYYPTEKRARAISEGLAYANWGERHYPADSYPRLIAAMAIDEAAAIESASWGLGQIMGENYRLVGFGSAREMVTAFAADEEAQLAAMVAFVKATGIADAARRGDWAAFAKRYNGPGYKKNRYDEKLAAAYAYWRKRADTMPPAEGPIAAKPGPIAAKPEAPGARPEPAKPNPAPDVAAGAREAPGRDDGPSDAANAPGAPPLAPRGLAAIVAAIVAAGAGSLAWLAGAANWIACKGPAWFINAIGAVCGG